MKSLWTKISATIGLLLSLACVFYLLLAGLCTIFPDLFHDGTPYYNAAQDAFHALMDGFIASLLAWIFFAIDAVLCAIKAFMKIDRMQNAISVLLILGGIPLAIAGCRYGAMTFVWLAYYIVVVALETLSVIRLIKACVASKRAVTE